MINVEGLTDEQAAKVRLWEQTVLDISYKGGYELFLNRDKANEGGRYYLQVKYWRPDALTGLSDWGYSGKSYVSLNMVLSEFVRACFGVFARLEEHECREAFRWKRRQIFGPHIDVNALWDAAIHTEARTPMGVQ